MISNCWFLIRGGGRRAKFIKKWLFIATRSQWRRPTKARGVAFCFACCHPVRGWRSNLPEVTSYKNRQQQFATTACNNVTKLLKSRSCTTRYYSISHTSQKDGNVTPVRSMPSTVPRPSPISEIVDHTEVRCGRISTSMKLCPCKQPSCTWHFLCEVLKPGKREGVGNASSVYGTSHCVLLGYTRLMNKEHFSYTIIFPFASQILNL